MRREPLKHAEVEIEVRYAETDQMGVVHHSSYLVYLEDGRLALMRALHEGGLPMARFAAAEAALLVVRRLAANVVREQSYELMLIQRTYLS